MCSCALNLSVFNNFYFIGVLNRNKTMGIPSRLINVGCMMAYMNYTPRTLDELLEANLQPMIERIRKDGTNAGENSNGEL